MSCLNVCNYPHICSSNQQTPIVGYHGEIRWCLLSPASTHFAIVASCMQHQVGSNLLQHQVGSNSPGHSLLNLALLFLLVTAPDFGTFDPVLVSLHPLNGRDVSWKIERTN